jgi:hypothetical protein
MTVQSDAKGNGSRFMSMGYMDDRPLALRDVDVKRVHMFDIPVLLREHAHATLGDVHGAGWWTIGEFRYVGGTDYETAVARRVMSGGRMTVEYGIEY